MYYIILYAAFDYLHINNTYTYCDRISLFTSTQQQLIAYIIQQHKKMSVDILNSILNNTINENVVDNIRYILINDYNTINNISNNNKHIHDNIEHRSNNNNNTDICIYSSSLRGRIWQLLLFNNNNNIVYNTESYTTKYIDLCKQGKYSDKYDKIRNDTARTFPNNHDFRSINNIEISSIRILNAFCHAKHKPVLHNNNNNNTTDTTYERSYAYIQGMNSLLGIILYANNEIDSYYIFTTLITQYIPLYYCSSHIGVEAGCKLIDIIIQKVDIVLYNKLIQYNLTAYIYAFSAVSSLSASVLSIDSILVLWDYLFALQCPDINIICVAAQVICCRDMLLSNNNNIQNILNYRNWPAYNIDIQHIINKTKDIISILYKQNDSLLHDIIKHTNDAKIVEKYADRKHK